MIVPRQIQLGVLLLLGVGSQHSRAEVGPAADGPVAVEGNVQRPLREWRHEERVVLLARSPDGRRLVTTGGLQAGSVRIWDAASGEQLARVGEHGNGVSAVAFSPDGTLLASAGWGGEINLWRAPDGKPLGRLPIQSSAVSSLAFTADGKLLVTATNEGIRFWDHAWNRLVHEIAAPKGSGLVSFVLSPDGGFLAGSRRGYLTEVFVLDLKTMTETTRMKQVFELEALCFSPDGKVLAGETKFEGAMLWNARTGRLLRWLGPAETLSRLSFQGKPSVLARRIAFSPDGRCVALARTSREVTLYEVRSGEERCRWVDHPGEITCLEFAPDGATFTTGSPDGVARAWAVDPFVGQARPRPPTSAKDCAPLFDDLLLGGRKSYRAMAGLATAPGEAVPFLAAQLHAVPSDAARTRKLFAELDDGDFAVRERAAAQLERLGEAVREALEKALRSRPPLEVRGRLADLLRELDEGLFGPERLQILRSIETLERIDSAEARQILRRLADGAPGVEETEEAKLALERNDRRKAGGR